VKLRLLRLATWILVVLALNPVQAAACSVCYGDPDSAMSRGLGWGIVALLGVVLTVLAGISAFFVHVAKRSAKTNVQ
jgi:hypothetical protein